MQPRLNHLAPAEEEWLCRAYALATRVSAPRRSTRVGMRAVKRTCAPLVQLGGQRHLRRPVRITGLPAKQGWLGCPASQ
ncbi:hypothetical protein L484_002981 [Morus notabilis]|uniref:Uncharacterized protein n=1 Tax=Morus notabilis TaxID=981085 RepID=W9SDI4_9ROSA|nr:hypothetical protein L484_002981 [Morus notabilis]